ncbi:hypothetical protein HV042_14450 [Klebsiella grimontii]|uniref:hypothetical protein n=1 Tax=Klebsiella grimontii TaxID=2058152 RepID=UPI0015E4F5E9|nr:hypothetical protein [Klebsiella grimontii]QLP08178.1 hypothetical protein HV042_14450 [Klebsiella grimontii]
MAHDVPLGCAPDEYDDLISGTCSHLPWFPDGDARVLEAQCRKITDIHMLSEETLLVAKWNMKNE